MHDLTETRPAWPAGTGEMAERIRAYDWGSTPLGPVEGWPQSLRTAVDLMLASPDPVSIMWGAERVQLYNDAYIPIAGERHVTALGRSAARNWSEAYAGFLGPVLDRVFGGETVRVDQQSAVLRTADGGVEERFFTGVFLPVRDEAGRVGGVFHPLAEVTAKVRADAALREREERLHRVLDGMGEGFGLLAPDFTILEHNREALRLDGRPRDEIVGRSHWAVYPGSEQSEVGRRLKKAMAERVPVSLEHLYAWEEGRARWLEMRAYPTDDGALAVFWRDVTDRREAEDALRAERDRSAEILESISDAFYAVDADWRFTYVNRRAEAWWDRRREDLLGKMFWAEFPQVVGSHSYKAHLRAAETREVVRLETVSPVLGHWVDITIYPTADGGLSVYFRDITSRKRSEETLRESEERLGLAIEIGEMASWDWDVRTGKVTWNDRHFGIQGYAVGEVAPSYEAWLARVHPEDRERTISLIEAARVTGETYAHELRYLRPDGSVCWCSARGRFFYDATGEPYRMIGVMEDVTERKRAEEAMRESEERLALAFRTLPIGLAIVEPSGALILANDEMRRFMPGGTLPSQDQQNVGRWRGWDAEGRPVEPGDFPGARALRGEVVVPGMQMLYFDGVRDIWTEVLSAPLEGREGRGSGALIVVIDVDRLKRSEEAAWESQERFRQFSQASSDALWIRHAETMALDYASPAMETIFGISQATLHADPRAWIAQIVPEDRDDVLAYLEMVRSGASVVHEFRIRHPSDDGFRWIRSAGFPLRNSDGAIERIAGISSNITEVRRLSEHQGVLLAELQHRVRNIMGVIRSMANRTASSAEEVDDYRARLDGRLLALGRVQALLTREANLGGSLRAIIESEVGAQAHHRHQLDLRGPDVQLSPKAVEVLTLAFHELATNAVKYGALSGPEGRLTVSWTRLERRGAPWLALDWKEEGAPPRGPSRHRGFGTELIEARIPYELGGSGTIAIGPAGASCHLEFPLRGDESILETDAPRPTTIFGGALDMRGAPDLSGRTVLVVDDDYYMAGDTAAALRGAGAEVLGPCPSVDAAQDMLESETPTHAVLDINLGSGPRFEVAHLLKARGVPFLFLTGYDPDVIPEDLQDVVRVQKPAPFRAIIEAISEL